MQEIKFMQSRIKNIVRMDNQFAKIPRYTKSQDK